MSGKNSRFIFLFENIIKQNLKAYLPQVPTDHISCFLQCTRSIPGPKEPSVLVFTLYKAQSLLYANAWGKQGIPRSWDNSQNIPKIVNPLKKWSLELTSYSDDKTGKTWLSLQIL